ncbi:MAG: hypothetical protein ACREQ5_06790 [Candidatus Dormibacteria bacterium]
MFAAKDPRKLTCKKDCGRTQTGRVRTNESRNGARSQHIADHILNFVGVDGEGTNSDNGSHEYILFSVGNESLYNKDGSQLHWEQILEFMWDHYCRHPTSVYIGFFLGYDFSQWLRTLPEKQAWQLLHKEGVEKRKRKESGGNPVPYPVRVWGERGNWEIDILGAKRFKLRPAVPKGEDRQPWLYVNDTGGYWQTSFLAAIDPKKWGGNPVATIEENQILIQGKAHRGCKPGHCEVPTVPGCTAGPDALPLMIKYNTTENLILARLTARLNLGFVKADIRLGKDQWYGPGQAASAWLDNIKAPTAAEIQEAVPEWVLEAARMTYYGGWFETMAHGHIPGITHEYDINSAYPYVISTLPCLLHGKWTHGKGHKRTHPKPGHLRIVHARLAGDFTATTGAMPHRLWTGGILRPNITSGWYWWHELVASRAAGLIKNSPEGHPDYDWGDACGWQIDEWVEYAPCKCDPPLAAIADLYQQRLAVGKNSPEGVALKLMYNSAYGKMAQSIGQPKYANSVYASLITAGCRTQILNAIATHPTKSQSMVMVATDGVYFREPHPSLELSDSKLGAWDTKEKHNLTLMIPGIYWDDYARKKIAQGEAPSLKSRGISASDLGRRVAELDQQWTDWNAYIIALPGNQQIDPDSWPTLELPMNFAMVSAKQAVTRGAWETAGQVTQDASHMLNSRPEHKRMVNYRGDLKIRDNVIYSVPHELPPAHQSYDVESYPYDKKFGIALKEMNEESPIGQDTMLAHEVYAWIFTRGE